MSPQADGDPDRTHGGGDPIRLAICTDGAYQLTVGGTSVRLNEADLAMLGRAIHVMAGRRPALLGKLIAATLGDDPDDDSIETD